MVTVLPGQWPDVSTSRTISPGDSPLLRAGAEDFGPILRANDAFIKVGSVNLEEHLQ